MARIGFFGIATLFINLAGCLLGAPAPVSKNADTGDTVDSSTGWPNDTDEDSSVEDTGYCAIPGSVTLSQGHFFVNLGTSLWAEYWLDGDADDDVVAYGDPNNHYWLTVDVESSAYQVDYEVSTGTRVDLNCDMRWVDEDGDEHSYCWNGGTATLEVFGVSCVPAVE